jgi:hypothetical protein
MSFFLNNFATLFFSIARFFIVDGDESVDDEFLADSRRFLENVGDAEASESAALLGQML